MIMAVAIQSFADETKTSPSTEKVGLDYKNSNQSVPTHRAPARIDLNVYYDAEAQIITVTYSGKADGDVYLYLNETLVDYDTEINTSFSLPSPTGLYRIEIITDNWTASGYLEL